MSTFSMRRLAASSALTAAVLAGSMLPATSAFAEDTTASETPASCDQTALDAAVVAATDEARVAKKAFIMHNNASEKALIARYKSREVREARVATRAAHKAEIKAARTARLAARAAKHSDAETRDAARAAAAKAKADFRVAAAKARVERREARKTAHATTKQLRAAVRAEHRTLKAEWDKAKAALHLAKDAAEDCRDASAPTEPAPTA